MRVIYALPSTWRRTFPNELGTYTTVVSYIYVELCIYLIRNLDIYHTINIESIVKCKNTLGPTRYAELLPPTNFEPTFGTLFPALPADVDPDGASIATGFKADNTLLNKLPKSVVDKTIYWLKEA